MASLDQLKQTFFDECSEALQQIELGLTDIREGSGSDDTINAVFRSVHSVKGGAGIFGFEDLVKFAHVFETVLDAMRSGKLARDAGDRRYAAAGQRRADGPDRDVAVRRGHPARLRLRMPRRARANSAAEFDRRGVGEDDGSPAPADFEGLDFMPVPCRRVRCARRRGRPSVNIESCSGRSPNC